MNLQAYLSQILTEAVRALGFEDLEPGIAPTKDPLHGDYSSAVAMSLAKTAKKPPLELAQDIVSKLSPNQDYICKISVSPPGFINFSVSADYLYGVLNKILEEKESFGQSKTGRGKSANVEFVSANPTGPLTVGHGRQAVLGDTVANILEWHGYDVVREYYYNDAGRQMQILSESVEARYLELNGKDHSFPEDGYLGQYIKDIADSIQKSHGPDLENGNPVFREEAEEIIFKDIRDSLEKLGVDHQKFTNEKSFYDSNAIDEVIASLKKKNLIYEAEGATWLKTTEFGRDQDRVLIKATGEPTYRLPDIAYHCDKLEREFDLAVDIFGADHMDTYPDVLSTVETLGYDITRFQVLIHQFVTLMKGGEKVKMSTRKGDFVTLNELIDQLGSDVVRYFFIMRSMNSHLNFDMDLAADQSEKNPVYYLQYAHARICSIIKHGESLGVDLKTEFDSSLLKLDLEMKLLMAADRFPLIMENVLDSLEPQAIANYLQELAAKFHKFYGECRVVSDDLSLTAARVALIQSVQTIIANGLNILGISAPEKM